MSEFFEDEYFKKMLSNNKLRRAEQILNIMKEMKAQDETSTIDTFICILHKIIDPSVSYSCYSAFMYMSAVEKWNDYNYKNKKFDLMITSKHLSY